MSGHSTTEVISGHDQRLAGRCERPGRDKARAASERALALADRAGRELLARRLSLSGRYVSTAGRTSAVIQPWSAPGQVVAISTASSMVPVWSTAYPSSVSAAKRARTAAGRQGLRRSRGNDRLRLGDSASHYRDDFRPAPGRRTSSLLFVRV
jgi:hypothetical protein